MKEGALKLSFLFHLAYLLRKCLVSFFLNSSTNPQIEKIVTTSSKMHNIRKGDGIISGLVNSFCHINKLI